jgi:MerR family transcriptional regulator, redox-sensitive transcriptional activator SoxR
MSDLTIGKVAAAANLRPSTIRYYEAEGLLPIPVRKSGKRVYAWSILNRLALIELASQCGFSLAEIHSMKQRFAAGTPPRKRWRLLAKSKLAELDEKMLQLSRMKRMLGALRRCKCLSIEECGMRARRSGVVRENNRRARLQVTVKSGATVPRRRGSL